MKKIIFVCLLLFISSAAYSQLYIMGYVKDSIPTPVSTLDKLPVDLTATVTYDTTARLPVKQLTGDSLLVKVKFDSVRTASDTASYVGAVRQLASHVCRYVIITTIPGDTSTVYYGFASGVNANTGIELANGDSVKIDCTNSNQIYFIASVSGTKIKYCWGY